MLVQLISTFGGHKIYNRTGGLVGIAERILLKDVVIIEEGLASDVGVFEVAAKGHVVAVWGFVPAQYASNEDERELVQGKCWPIELPEGRAAVADGRLYSRKELVCTADELLVSNGQIYCRGPSAIPEQ